MTEDFRGLRVAAFESRMATEMTRLIERYGGRPRVAPSMREIPLQDNGKVLEFGERLLNGDYDTVIFLTGVGTRTMFQALKTHYPLEAVATALHRITLVARGPKPISALKECGLAPNITVPEPNTWRDLLHELDRASPIHGRRVAVQEYGEPNDELLKGLRERGAEVDRVPVYRWALPEDLGPLRQVIEKILDGEVDVMLITNAVQIDHVVQLMKQEDRFEDGAQQLKQAAERMVVASIGPTASERLRYHGLPVDLEPSHPKMGTLVKETSERARSLLAAKRTASEQA